MAGKSLWNHSPQANKSLRNYSIWQTKINLLFLSYSISKCLFMSRDLPWHKPFLIDTYTSMPWVCLTVLVKAIYYILVYVSIYNTIKKINPPKKTLQKLRIAIVGTGSEF
jgi:hypothetical protein